MRWTFVFCVLIASTTLIASSVHDESRHKRGLSFLTSFFVNGMDTAQRRPNTSRRKPTQKKKTSPLSDQQNDGVEKVRSGKKRKQTRTKVVKRVRNNGSSFLTNFAYNPYRAISQALGVTNISARTTTEKSSKESQKKLQNLSGNRVIPNSKSIVTPTPENLNVVANFTNAPKTYAPSDIPLINPMMEMPRTYTNGQIKSETLPLFTFDNNSDFIVYENAKQLPRPAYVDHAIENLILKVPPTYGQQVYPSFANQQYENTVMYPNVAFDHREGNYGLDILPNNYLSTYTGEPIIVLEHTSEIMKTPKFLQDNDINKIISQHSEKKQRGDIPDGFY